MCHATSKIPFVIHEIQYFDGIDWACPVAISFKYTFNGIGGIWYSSWRLYTTAKPSSYVASTQPDSNNLLSRTFLILNGQIVSANAPLMPSMKNLLVGITIEIWKNLTRKLTLLLRNPNLIFWRPSSDWVPWSGMGWWDRYLSDIFG